MPRSVARPNDSNCPLGHGISPTAPEAEPPSHWPLGGAAHWPAPSGFDAHRGALSLPAIAIAIVIVIRIVSHRAEKQQRHRQRHNNNAARAFKFLDTNNKKLQCPAKPNLALDQWFLTNLCTTEPLGLRVHFPGTPRQLRKNKINTN